MCMPDVKTYCTNMIVAWLLFISDGAGFATSQPVADYFFSNDCWFYSFFKTKNISSTHNLVLK